MKEADFLHSQQYLGSDAWKKDKRIARLIIADMQVNKSIYRAKFHGGISLGHGGSRLSGIFAVKIENF